MALVDLAQLVNNMINEKPLIGHNYIHIKSRVEYTVLWLGSLKSPNDDQWYNAVFYKRADEIEGVYARTVANFTNNFEEVENVIEL